MATLRRLDEDLEAPPPLSRASSSFPTSGRICNTPARTQTPPPPPPRAHAALPLHLDTAALRRLHTPPAPLSSSDSSPFTLALLPLALAWSKDALSTARKVWMPILVYAVVACCHLLGWGMLVYSTLALWGPTASAESFPDPLAPPRLVPAPGSVSLADFQGLGFVTYMFSILTSFWWLQHYISTRREQEMQRWRGSGSGPLGA